MSELRKNIRKQIETTQGKCENLQMIGDDVGNINLRSILDELEFFDDDDQAALDAARCESDCTTTLIAEIDPPPGYTMEELPLSTNVPFPKGYDDINFLEIQDECEEIDLCLQTEYEKIAKALENLF